MVQKQHFGIILALAVEEKRSFAVSFSELRADRRERDHKCQAIVRRWFEAVVPVEPGGFFVDCVDDNCSDTDPFGRGQGSAQCVAE
jgi:hypothetical protein